MKELANMLSDSKKIDFNFKYKHISSLDDADKSIPTMIIGYKNAKKYIKNFNILQKYYPEQNLWWTFKKNEKRYEYENDMSSFSNFVIHDIIKNINYILIDLITIDRTMIIKLVKYILNNNNKIIYNLYNKFLFIYDKSLKTVYGLSLSTLRYFGVSIKKVMNIITRNKNNNLIGEMDNIPVEIKKQISTNIHYQLCLYEYFS